MSKITKKTALYCMLSSLMSIYTQSIFATVYCSHGGSYLKIGMTTGQVSQACGKPLSSKKKKVYATQNIPIQQLFYTFRNSSQKPNAFTNTNRTENRINLTISVINKKISSLSLNGGAITSVSVCPYGMIQIGSNAASIISACGTPAYVNNSFRTTTKNGTEEQKTWVIKPSEYEKPLTLIFKNDVLKSIQ